jgi:hypothetical protein
MSRCRPKSPNRTEADRIYATPSQTTTFAMTAGLAVLPATRAASIDALFIRDTTFEQTLRLVRQEVPSGSAIACPEPVVARDLRAAIPVESWDPWALRSRPVWYAIVPRHPFVSIGTDPGLASVVLPAMGSVATVATFSGLDPDDWRGATFEAADWFYYPIRGFGAVRRAGPDLDIVRVVPFAPESRSAPPPPPVLTVTVRPDALNLSFAPPPGFEVLAYYVRYASEQGAGSAVVPDRTRFPPGPTMSPLLAASCEAASTS